MAKEIVCLAQTVHTGKSASIIALAELLINTRGYPPINWMYPSSPPKNITAENDVCVVVDVNSKNRKAGLASHGDDPAVVSTNLTNLINAGCDIIFCACHTPRSDSYKAVKAIAQTSGYRLIWASPYTEATVPNLPLPACSWPINQMKARHLEDFI
jgi:hypothetical protein